MGKVIRRVVLLLGAAIALSATGANASTAVHEKLWVGLGGVDLCRMIPQYGQSFPAQENTKYEVVVQPIVNDSHAQACIRFKKLDGSLTDVVVFSDRHKDDVPDNAVEAWILVTHTTPEMSYSQVILPLPSTITYTDGLV